MIPIILEWADQTTTKKCDGTVRNQTNDFSRCEANGGENCTMTWNDGTTSSISGNQAAVDAGTNYVTAYAATSVPWGSTCTSQRRYCQETSPGSGVQQITGTYTAKNCTIQPPANCTAPWGAGVAHGTSVAAYQSASVNAPGTCISESRGCINGSLSGSYTNQNCVVNSTGTWVFGGMIGNGLRICHPENQLISPYGESCVVGDACRYQGPRSFAYAICR